MAERKVSDAEQAFDDVTREIDDKLPKLAVPDFTIDYRNSYYQMPWVSSHFITPDGVLITAKKTHNRIHLADSWFARDLNNYPNDTLLAVPASEVLLYSVTAKDLASRKVGRGPANSTSTIYALTKSGEKSDLANLPYVRSRITIEHGQYGNVDVPPVYADTPRSFGVELFSWVVGKESDMHSFDRYHFKLITDRDAKQLLEDKENINRWIEIPALLRGVGHLGK